MVKPARCRWARMPPALPAPTLSGFRIANVISISDLPVRNSSFPHPSPHPPAPLPPPPSHPHRERGERQGANPKVLGIESRCDAAGPHLPGPPLPKGEEGEDNKLYYVFAFLP